MSTGSVMPSGGRQPETPKKLEASGFYKKQNGEWVPAQIPPESKKIVEKLLGDIKEIGSQIASFQEFKVSDKEYEVTSGSIKEKGNEFNVLNKEELEGRRAEINKTIEDIAKTLHVEPSEFKLTAKVAFDPYQKILEEAKTTANGMKKSITDLEFIEQNKQEFLHYVKEEGGNPAFLEKCLREAHGAKAAVEEFSGAMDEVDVLAKRGKKKEAIEAYAKIVTEKLPTLVEKTRDFAFLMDEAQIFEKEGTPYLNAFRRLCKEKGVDEKGKDRPEIKALLVETQLFAGLFSKFFQNPLKYPLLTRELLKNTDASQQQLLENAQTKLEKIAFELNEYKRAGEQRTKRLSGSFFESKESPDELFEDLRFKNNLNKSNLARKDLRAFGEISDRYGEIIGSLNAQLDNVVKEEDPYKKAILREQLKAEAQQKLSEINKLTAKFEKWGGRKKLQNLLEAVRTYGDQAEYSLRTNLRKLPGYTYDESKSAKDNYEAALKQIRKEKYRATYDVNYNIQQYMQQAQSGSIEGLPAYIDGLSEEQKKAPENALLLATLDYVQIGANQKIQHSLEYFSDKASFLNELYDETRLRMDFPFKEMENFGRQFASDLGWQKICEKNQITAKDISRFSALQDRLAKEVEPIYLAEKRLADDPTNPELQTQLRKAYAKHESAIGKTLKEIKAGRERFSGVFKAFEEFKVIVDRRLEKVSEEEMDNDRKLREEGRKPDKYDQKKLELAKERRTFEAQKSLLERTNFREVYDSQLDLLNSVSKKLSSPLSSERGAATYHLALAPNASSDTKKVWQDQLGKHDLHFNDLKSFSGLFNRFQSLLSPLLAAKRDMDMNPGDTKKERAFERLKDKNQAEIDQLKAQFRSWGGKEKLGVLIGMHEAYYQELRKDLEREEPFALGHRPDQPEPPRFAALKKEVTRLENLDLFTTMDEQVSFLEQVL